MNFATDVVAKFMKGNHDLETDGAISCRSDFRLLLERSTIRLSSTSIEGTESLPDCTTLVASVPCLP